MQHPNPQTPQKVHLYRIANTSTEHTVCVRAGQSSSPDIAKWLAGHSDSSSSSASDDVLHTPAQMTRQSQPPSATAEVAPATPFALANAFRTPLTSPK